MPEPNGRVMAGGSKPLTISTERKTCNILRMIGEDDCGIRSGVKAIEGNACFLGNRQGGVIA